jgi:CheY-like chemotaxis protein
MIPLGVASQEACDLAPLIGIVVLEQRETLNLLQAGLLGHASEVLSTIAEGTLLERWRHEHEGLRTFAAGVLDEIAAVRGKPFHCAFRENERISSAVMSLFETGPDGLSFREIDGHRVCTIRSLEVLRALSALYRTGAITLISDVKKFEEVLLYGLLRLLPSLEGDGNTIYLSGAEPEDTVTVRKRPLVALLEDDEALSEWLGNELRGEGYDVAAFCFKDEFLCRIKHHVDELPDLVISDLMSPRMHGLEFLRIFRSDPGHCRVPVIVISGNIPRRKKEALRLGAYRCLSKPISINAVLNLVSRVLRKRGISV